MPRQIDEYKTHQLPGNLSWLSILSSFRWDVVNCAEDLRQYKSKRKAKRPHKNFNLGVWKRHASLNLKPPKMGNLKIRNCCIWSRVNCSILRQKTITFYWLEWIVRHVYSCTLVNWGLFGWEFAFNLVAFGQYLNLWLMLTCFAHAKLLHFNEISAWIVHLIIFSFFSLYQLAWHSCKYEFVVVVVYGIMDHFHWIIRC